LGLRLGSRIGLGAPEIEAIINKRPRNQRHLQSSILPAIVLGTVGGIFLQVVGIIYKPYMPPELTQIEPPGFIPALLASFGAGVNEEIWLRLGVMTCLVWLGSVLMRQPKPGKTIMWSANVFAALAFGMLHLPQTAIFAGGLTLSVTILVLSLNGFVGVIFGWLYWRHGLLAAMIAHFSTDVVIHVLPALSLTAAN
jgi:membrane protease YdiL (CAAX protease family)